MCWFKERNYYFITEMCNTIIWFSFSELLSLNLRWINTFQFVFNVKVFATNVTQKYRPQRSKLLKFLYLELREGYVVYALLLWRNKKKKSFFPTTEEAESLMTVTKCCLHLFSTVSIIWWDYKWPRICQHSAFCYWFSLLTKITFTTQWISIKL